MTLVDLIALLETTKDGSSDLDALISDTIFDPAAGRDRLGGGVLAAGGENGGVLDIDAPDRTRSYTTSIDAALALVPPGWSWHVRLLHRGDPPMPVIHAVAFNDRAGMVLASECCDAEADTAPMALCIAALRAHAALQKAGAARGFR
jgi:hypothetical protein